MAVGRVTASSVSGYLRRTLGIISRPRGVEGVCVTGGLGHVQVSVDLDSPVRARRVFDEILAALDEGGYLYERSAEIPSLSVTGRAA